MTIEKENLMDSLDWRLEKKDCRLDVNKGRIGELDNIPERNN